jgi:hypothetical protein
MAVIRFAGLGLLLVASTAIAQSGPITLYSPNKYPNEKLNFCLNFKTGIDRSITDPCDLRYGFLYAGDDWDWFQSSLEKNSRSVIKDLGELSWTSQFKVPVVDPLPKLLQGQERNVTVDVSGADGADGAPGAPGAPGADADGVVRQGVPVQPVAQPSPSPARKKNDGKPKIDPVFVKAVVGHMYVAHVVDEQNDFYALFRVDALERGDYCVVSWKVINPPRVAAKLGSR